MKKPKVIIFGAGVGGLTAAHMLAKAGYDNIDIYEKNSTAGGLARTEGDDPISTREISWRVYFHFYYHLFSVMKDIPSIDGKSVYDHLVKYRNVFTPEIDPWKFMSAKQIFSIVRNLASSDSRLDSLDTVPWREFIGSDSSEIPQWLGMDRFKGSTTSVQRIGIEQHLRKTKGVEDYVLDGPTSEIWLDPWVEHLKGMGVRFHFNTSVEKVDSERNGSGNSPKITGATLANGEKLTSDIWILALPIEVLAVLVPTLVPNGLRLADLSKQIQIAFQLYLDAPLSLGFDKDGSPYQSFLVRDSPWALIVESKSISWGLGQSPPRSSKDKWSITACQADVSGILHKKPLVLCSQKEMQEEIMAQLYANSNLMARLKRENPKVDIDQILKSAVWSLDDEKTIMSTFKITNGTRPEDSSLTSTLTTSEPKFSNNTGTKSIRPSFVLGSNAYLATAYARETIDVFSMEAAAISGKMVAAKIMGVELPKLPPRPYALEPFRQVDDILYKLGVADVLVVVLLIIAILILWWLFKKYGKR